jgi:hypothetical protein
VVCPVHEETVFFVPNYNAFFQRISADLANGQRLIFHGGGKKAFEGAK